VSVCITYPDGTVGLPGTGRVPSRVTGVGGIADLFDFDNAASLSLLPQPPGQVLNPVISFDRCGSAPAPPPTAFDCVPRSGADEFGNPFDATQVQQIDCTPVTP
jgi:hypothetical protein